jgi:predicted GNAT superfamily acetyltransferase
MLGVLDGYRDLGLGRKLKLAQREDALSRGIHLIEWTFDPLELKNAFFNIERLGAIVRRFVFNQYGTTSSTLQAGLPTDRCIAEWHINTARVDLLLAGRGVECAEIEARISVPNDIAVWKRSDPKRARAVQAEVSGQFERHLAAGLTVVGFERGSENGSYLLSRTGAGVPDDR